MLEVMMFDYTRCQFQGYDELFGYLSETENLKLIEETPDFTTMNWSFNVYSPEQVEALHTHMKNQPAAIQEAFEQQLPVIEICKGDFDNPFYVSVTPNIDQASYQKGWCIDYCDFHHLAITENAEAFRTGRRKMTTKLKNKKEKGSFVRLWWLSPDQAEGKLYYFINKEKGKAMLKLIVTNKNPVAANEPQNSNPPNSLLSQSLPRFTADIQIEDTHSLCPLRFTILSIFWEVLWNWKFGKVMRNQRLGMSFAVFLPCNMITWMIPSTEMIPLFPSF